MSFKPIDGNMIDLARYEREQDALEAADMYLEAAQIETANSLFDGYFANNHAVIDEVNQRLMDEDASDNLINKLREAGTVECERPIMGRGCEVWPAYSKLIEAVCMEIAQGQKTIEDLERFRLDMGV